MQWGFKLWWKNEDVHQRKMNALMPNRRNAMRVVLMIKTIISDRTPFDIRAAAHIAILKSGDFVRFFIK